MLSKSEESNKLQAVVQDSDSMLTGAMRSSRQSPLDGVKHWAKRRGQVVMVSEQRAWTLPAGPHSAEICLLW